MMDSLPLAAISHLTAGRSQIGASLSFGSLAMLILGYATEHQAWFDQLVTDHS